MKKFDLEFDKMVARLKKGDPFSFSRFGDGELNVIKKIKTHIHTIIGSEVLYDIKNKNHACKSDELLKALQYQAHNYFVGVSCACCIGESLHKEYIQISKQPNENLTFATLFVNANYNQFLTEFLPNIKEAVLIANLAAQTKNLPFKVKQRFNVGQNAWVNYEPTLQSIETYITTNKINGQIFVFCAGIASCLLIYHLHKKYPQNTYIDLGSTLDVLMGIGKTRRYLKGQETINKTCKWE